MLVHFLSLTLALKAGEKSFFTNTSQGDLGAQAPAQQRGQVLRAAHLGAAGKQGGIERQIWTLPEVIWPQGCWLGSENLLIKAQYKAYFWSNG